MAIIARLKRVFRADLNGILDCLEEPRELVKQALRDMEAEVEAQERELQQALAHCERLARLRENKQEKVQQCQEKIVLCFAEAQDELARFFVKKKLEAERELEQVEGEQARLAEQCSQLTEMTKEHRETLESLREKLSLFSETEDLEDLSHSATTTVSEEEVEVEFLQAKRRHDSPSSGHA